MIYRLKNEIEARNAQSRLEYLTRKGKKIEIKERRALRTLNQNSYLHLIIGYFGSQYGLNLLESKQYYKMLNEDLYYYEKSGYTYIKSSKDLDKAQMARSIDRFIDHAEANGIQMPRTGEQEFIDHCNNQIEQNSAYL